MSEVLQTAEKRGHVKGKGQKERYTHLNAEFQRTARRDKKVFLTDQCKETEKNNPCSSAGKEFAYNAEDLGSIPKLGRSPGEGNGNPLQYSCHGKIPWTEEPGGLQSMGLQKSWTQLSD